MNLVPLLPRAMLVPSQLPQGYLMRHRSRAHRRQSSRRSSPPTCGCVCNKGRDCAFVSCRGKSDNSGYLDSTIYYCGSFPGRADHRSFPGRADHRRVLAKFSKLVEWARAELEHAHPACGEAPNESVDECVRRRRGLSRLATRGQGVGFGATTPKPL